jgi:hypothetical protein
LSFFLRGQSLYLGKISVAFFQAKSELFFEAAVAVKTTFPYRQLIDRKALPNFYVAISNPDPSPSTTGNSQDATFVTLERGGPSRKVAQNRSTSAASP